MSDQLEPGDLAIIIKSVDGASVGRIVTCLQVDGVHSELGVMWLVESPTDLVTIYGGVGKRAHVPQRWLRKIPRQPVPGEENEKQADLVS